MSHAISIALKVDVTFDVTDDVISMAFKVDVTFDVTDDVVAFVEAFIGDSITVSTLLLVEF